MTLWFIGISILSFICGFYYRKSHDYILNKALVWNHIIIYNNSEVVQEQCWKVGYDRAGNVYENN